MAPCPSQKNVSTHFKTKDVSQKKVSTHLVFICNSAEQLARGPSYVLLDQKHITSQQTFTSLPALVPVQSPPFLSTQLDIYGSIKIVTELKTFGDKTQTTQLSQRVEELSITIRSAKAASISACKNHISQHIKSVDYTKFAILLHMEIWISIKSKDSCLLAWFLPVHAHISCAVGPSFPLQHSICPPVFDLPSVRLLHESRLYLLFTERTVSRYTSASTGDTSKACWHLFQPVLSHSNSILQL